MSNEILLGFEAIQVTNDEAFWNWFAGFWEGEGSLCFQQEYHKDDGRAYKKIRLSVSQADRTALNYIYRTLGLGYIYFRKPTRFRKTHQVFNDRGTWIWSLDKRKEVIVVCRKLLPYLRSRREMVEAKLRLIENFEAEAGWHTWYPNETQFLRGRYALASKDELVSTLSRNWPSIKQKAQKMGLRRHG